MCYFCRIKHCFVAKKQDLLLIFKMRFEVFLPVGSPDDIHLSPLTIRELDLNTAIALQGVSRVAWIDRIKLTKARCCHVFLWYSL